MSVGGSKGLSGVCRAGLTLKSRSQLTILAIQPVWSVETRRRFGGLRMVFTRCASFELEFGALREMVARERQRALSRKTW